jgi:hypothetical protein
MSDLFARIDAAVETQEFGSELSQEGMAFTTLTKKLNEVLSHYQLKELTPQYVRNMAMSGRVDGTKYTSLKGVRFSEDVAQDFIVRFVARRVS